MKNFLENMWVGFWAGLLIGLLLPSIFFFILGFNYGKHVITAYKDCIDNVKVENYRYCDQYK